MANWHSASLPGLLPGLLLPELLLGLLMQAGEE